MSRPEGVSAARWKAVRPVLQAIDRYPNTHPSIAWLVRATKKSERTVRYALRWAEEAALLRTNLSVGRGLANEYEVLCCDHLKGATKRGNVAPLRRSTTYSNHYVREDDVVKKGRPRRRTDVVGQTSLDEPPWWMLEVRPTRKGSDEVWPRDAQGRRLALLEGKCFLCGQPLIRYSDGQVIPPRAVLVRFPQASRDVPVHMAGGCPGSRPGGPGFIRVGDIAQEQDARRRARLQP